MKKQLQSCKSVQLHREAAPLSIRDPLECLVQLWIFYISMTSRACLSREENLKNIFQLGRLPPASAAMASWLPPSTSPAGRSLATGLASGLTGQDGRSILPRAGGVGVPRRRTRPRRGGRCNLGDGGRAQPRRRWVGTQPPHCGGGRITSPQ
jgi:hypothetical protein